MAEGTMKEIPMNAQVRCADGKCGKSTYVIVDPVKRRITHFVVKYKKLPENPDRLVPVEKIAKIGDKKIRLDCTRAELAEMQPFTTRRFVQKGEPDYAMAYMAGDPNAFTQPMVAVDTWTVSVPEYHVPHGELGVHRGMEVKTGKGKVGTVDELVVDPESGNITHLMMRKGHLWGAKDVAIPVSAIEEVTADKVYLTIDNAAVEALPTVPVKRYFG
jgi:sporulation protein YlmC with PRC-barrel domain